MMSDEIKNQTQILREILEWIKVSSIKNVKQILEDNLNSDTKKLIYHYSDGIRGTQDFEKVAMVKRIATISNCWKEWKRLGILEGVSVKGGERGKKIFSLGDFGIEIPETKKNIPEEKILVKENPSEEKTDIDILEGEDSRIENLEEKKEGIVEDGQEF